MKQDTLLAQMKLDLDTYLEEYLASNYAVYSFELFKGRGPEVKVKTMTLEDQLEAEATLKDIPENEVNLYRMHAFQLEVLSRTLVSFGDKVFKDYSEVKSFLVKKNPAIIDKLLLVQRTFEKLFLQELNHEDLENFSPTPSTDTKPE